MHGLEHLRKVGRDFMLGGSLLAAVSLFILIYDELMNGGRESVAATCTLFIWAGAIGAAVGLAIRMFAVSRTRTRLSPLSPRWQPPPYSRARSRR